ncbi:MAG: hypothetical protein IT319_18210 [Anaerolineae bacterium]|nr:hypothetical protein [Anaerolineae bacterium]
MLSRRISGVLLAGVLLIVLGVSARSTVQADPLLQDVPRLDGMNIYFTEAGGEASRFDRSDSGLSRFAGLLSQLGANLFTLEWRTGFPTDADLIVIAGPANDLPPDQIARLWSYMNNQGRVLLLADASTRGSRGALPMAGGLFELMWSDMGLRAHDDVVVAEGTEPVFAAPDPEATAEVGAAVTEAPTGERPILIADFVTTDINTAHPITQNLVGPLEFSMARSLEVDASIQGFVVTPLVFSDRTFYGEAAYATYLTDGVFDFNIGQDTTRGALPLAAAYQNDRVASRIVVIGDREFATNAGGLRTSPPNSAGFLFPDNARFLMNAVTWLLDQPSVSVEFPTPGPTATVTITPSPTPTRTPTPVVTPTPAS